MMVVVALILVVAGVVTVMVGYRAERGRLGRKPVAGAGVAPTMRTDGTWRVAHEAGRPVTVASGVFATLLGVVVIIVGVVGESGATMTWLMVGAIALLVVGVLAGIYLGVRAARRAIAED